VAKMVIRVGGGGGGGWVVGRGNRPVKMGPQSFMGPKKCFKAGGPATEIEVYLDDSKKKDGR